MGKGEIATRTRRNSLSEVHKNAFSDQYHVPGTDSMPHSVPVVKGCFDRLPPSVQTLITEHIAMCQPKALYLCDGSEEESSELIDKLLQRGMLQSSERDGDCLSCHPDPVDSVHRSHKRTYVVTSPNGQNAATNQQMSSETAMHKLATRFPGCMKGRNLYVLPIRLGPAGNPLSRLAVQLTDSSFVALSIGTVATVTESVWKDISAGEEYMQCVHSVGSPRPVQRRIVNHWPCNPKKTLTCYFPDDHLVMSYGSGHWFPSHLGLTLCLAGTMAHEEGWLAEPMTVVGIRDTVGQEKVIAVAGMEVDDLVECGYDARLICNQVAWMRFDGDHKLHVIDPLIGMLQWNKNGSYTMTPALTHRSNDNADHGRGSRLRWLLNSTILVHMPDSASEHSVSSGDSCADGGIEHRDSHNNVKDAYTTSDYMNSCKWMLTKQHDPEGVAVDAIVFAGLSSFPSVVEAHDWSQAVFMRAASMMTCSHQRHQQQHQQHQRQQHQQHHPERQRHENGDLLDFNLLSHSVVESLQHWLELPQVEQTVPKVFSVQELSDGVMNWICQRIDDIDEVAQPTPIGMIPVEWKEELLPKNRVAIWRSETEQLGRRLLRQFGCQFPEVIAAQIQQQMQRFDDDDDDDEEVDQ